MVKQIERGERRGTTLFEILVLFRIPRMDFFYRLRVRVSLGRI